MPNLIATDEAGYGPKLGPLVIVATVWDFPNTVSVESAFEPLRTPFADTRCNSVFVDDSKRVFKRDEVLSSGKSSMLEVVCGAAAHWCALPDPKSSFFDWIHAVAEKDVERLDSPWFTTWKQKTTQQPADKENMWLNASLVGHWASTGVALKAIKARFITAAAFNRQIDHGRNKADVLTEATCQMVSEAIGAFDETEMLIFSDRHGGRAYYGASVQEACAGMVMHVVSENAKVSRYRLATEEHNVAPRVIDWSFSVGGDSFAPVAMSSIIAKWLREQAMASFNDYFRQRMPSGQALKPTAGYPSDANRFLADIETAGLRKTIDDQILIRKR